MAKQQIRFDLLESGKLDEIPSDQARFFLRHYSANCHNLRMCEEIDKMFFNLKPKVVLSLIYLCCDTRTRVKYPKGQKQDDEREDIARKYLKQMYHWSDIEFDKNRHILNFDDNFFIELHKEIGLTKEECKKVNVTINVEKQKFEEKKTNSLFSYM